MSKTLLKIGLVVTPIIIMWFSGWVYVSLMMFLYPPMLSLQQEGGMSISMSNQLPYFGSYVVLGLAIYLSIKLWIRYIHE